MTVFLEDQERRNKELLAAMEKKLAIRIANARAANAEEVAESKNGILTELQKDKVVEVYEISSKLDTAGPLSVVGSNFLRASKGRTSEYGSLGSEELEEVNNNDQAELKTYTERDQAELKKMNKKVKSTKAKMTN